MNLTRLYEKSKEKYTFFLCSETTDIPKQVSLKLRFVIREKTPDIINMIEQNVKRFLITSTFIESLHVSQIDVDVSEYLLKTSF